MLGAVGWRSIPQTNITPALMQFASFADPNGTRVGGQSGLLRKPGWGEQPGAQEQASIAMPSTSGGDGLAPLPTPPSVNISYTAPAPAPITYNIPAPPQQSAPAPPPQQRKQPDQQMERYWNAQTGQWYEAPKGGGGAYGPGTGYVAGDPHKPWYMNR